MRKRLTLNTIAELSSGARGLNFGLIFHLHPYFVYASSKALACSCICTGSPKPSLLIDVISTKILYTTSYNKTIHYYVEIGEHVPHPLQSHKLISYMIFWYSRTSMAKT